jgi:hypothetical protein
VKRVEGKIEQAVFRSIGLSSAKAAEGTCFGVAREPSWTDSVVTGSVEDTNLFSGKPDLHSSAFRAWAIGI